jgi:hypothetical protein
MGALSAGRGSLIPPFESGLPADIHPADRKREIRLRVRMEVAVSGKQKRRSSSST